MNHSNSPYSTKHSATDNNDNVNSASTPITSVDVLKIPKPASSLPSLFISHGAPSFALESNATTNALARIGQNLPTPNAIIIMSAHWVSHTLEISNNLQPHTWHDFSGFDAKLQHIEYPAKGLPQLAESITAQLNKKGIQCNLNPLRPFDHGVWAPLLHLFPQADIPIVQISLPKFFDSYACFQLGHLFSQLRHEQILIIGSGSITHDLKGLKWHARSEDHLAKSFKNWMLKQLKTDIPNALDWQQFESIEKVHPTPEHLLPLFFALGCGQRVSVVHESMAHHSLGMDIYRFD